MKWLAVLLVACGGTNSTGPHVIVDGDGLFGSPGPSDALGPAATVAAFPNPSAVDLVEQARGLLAGVDGFATTGGAWFQISEPVDPTTLPDIAGSVGVDASAFIVALDTGERVPLEVSFAPDATPFSAPNLVTLLPLQGTPLRPGTTYAAVVTTAVRTTSGEALAPATDDGGFAGAAGVTVFTTTNPAAGLTAARDAAIATLPVIDAPFAQTDVFADFCVYHTTIDMPDYQTGTPPFDAAGGAWVLDASGAPVLQRHETANLVVTVPRTPAPAAGYPLVVFVRTGGGGDRPLVDRGTQPGEGQSPLEPGEGPARYLARAGFAGIEVDGPLGGLRNTTGGDEQFLTFNVGNLSALRDNVRESALELDVIAHVGVALQIATTDCAGASATATFDADHVAIMGHSMGAWIAPLAAAAEPMVKALVLSGAGGSWIENILYKKQPVDTKPVISSILHELDLRADDPVMSFSQWALESADPQVYGAANRGRHVLMVQGIVDDYILPRIANATSLSMGLDLAGPELDTIDDPRLAGELPVGPLLPLDGRAAIALPASNNASGATAVVTQHMEDGLEDGHEVLFQEDVPKHEYQCFLASWLATGVPSVPTDASRDAPCP
jgi:pimeloyl-ACP methyl ester carboxylesterase